MHFNSNFFGFSVIKIQLFLAILRVVKCGFSWLNLAIYTIGKIVFARCD